MNTVLDEIARLVGRAWARAWLEKLQNVEASDKRDVNSRKGGDEPQSPELTPAPIEREDRNGT